MGTTPVFACIPVENVQCAYLGADVPNGISPRLLPLSSAGKIISVGMTDQSSDGSVAFFSPWTGKFLVAAPHGSDSSTGHAILGAQQPQDYEKLYLDDVNADEVPAYLSAASSSLTRLSNPTPTCEVIIDFLESVPPSPITFEVLHATALLLSRREISRLAITISASDALLDLLSNHFPEHLFAQHAIGPLVKW